jgi:hypothetical protein
MAMTFVTGLCTATFLTIIIVPVEWDMLTAFKERRSGKGEPGEVTTIRIEKLAREHGERQI